MTSSRTYAPNASSVPPPERAIYKEGRPRQQPPSPAPDQAPAPTSERRGCLSPLIMALVIVALSCGCLALSTGWLSQVGSPSTRVLILGLDRRPEQDYTVRSDVIMLVGAYPAEPRVAMLSIPRDLYLDIPGVGKSRINTAHFWGEHEEEGGGPVLAMETVRQNFGVPVNRYVRVDFDAFTAVVDAAGGVTVVVEEPIVDNAYPTENYGTTRIEIPAGEQHMDGERALQYVRTRHGSSDFERAERQQQVLMALARQLASPSGVARLPAVASALLDHVDTNLGPVGMLQLGITALRVGPDGFDHRVIDRDMVTSWTTPTGGAVLLPRWEVINPAVAALFPP